MFTFAPVGAAPIAALAPSPPVLGGGWVQVRDIPESWSPIAPDALTVAVRLITESGLYLTTEDGAYLITGAFSALWEDEATTPEIWTPI